MAQVNEVIEGLEILARTARVPARLAEQGETDTRTAHLMGARHDIIYGPDAKPTAKEIERLDELGWHFDSEVDVWACFV